MAAAVVSTENLGTTAAPKKTTTKTQLRHLVIVESPAKCKTIEKILNSRYGGGESSSSNNNNNNNNNHDHDDIHYTVLSCRGHIRDLSKRKMPTVSFPYPIAGIDLDSGDYTADYVVGTETSSRERTDRRRRSRRPGDFRD
jgi:DNA topoisomerase IA